MASPKSTPPLRLFYSYAHNDSVFLGQLKTHLAPLKREGIIQEWCDHEIGPGHEWERAISENLETADVILLLVSADFLASDYCYEKEMRRALERHDAGEARVIPVILREVDWKRASFGKLQALPRDERSVASWSNQDDAWANIARGLRREIEKLGAEREREIDLLEKIKPEEFRKTVLSLEDYRAGAEILFDLVEKKHNFDPDLLIAINQGGMATAAALSKHWHKPVGVMYTAVNRNRRVIRDISLPCEIISPAKPLDQTVEPQVKLRPAQPKRILIVDPKLKTGDSAESIRDILQQAYGEGLDIRYAIVLAYGGWGPLRWKVTYTTPFEWPIRFKPKELDVYVAYYTDVDPPPDRIKEELHP